MVLATPETRPGKETTVTGSRVRQLEAANLALAAREAQFRTIFESVHDAILVLDCEQGTLLDMNRRMTEMSGFAKEELLGSDLGKLSFGLSPYTGEDALRWIHKAREGMPITLEWLSRTASNRLLWVEMSLLMAQLGGETRILATVRDISERKRAESEHSTRLKRAESQNAVSLALAGAGPDFETALDLIVQLGDFCCMYLLEGGRLKSVATSQSYLDGDALLPALNERPDLPLAISGVDQVFRSKETHCIQDPEGDAILSELPAAFHPYCRRYQIRTLLMVPMRFQEHLVGLITLGAAKPYSFEDQSMLQGMADRTALTITNGRLYRENLAQAEALRRINAELEQRVADRTAELAQATRHLRCPDRHCQPPPLRHRAGERDAPGRPGRAPLDPPPQ